MKQVLALALIAGLIAAPANAGNGMLYKAVDSNGTVLFSDVPPSGDSVTVIEQRSLQASGDTRRAGPNAGEAIQLTDGDEGLARANEQVDMAEHALALARRNVWSANEGLTMRPARMAPADAARIEFYKKNLRTARTYLAELVRDRQAQAVQVAAASAPTAPVLVATNYVTR